MNKPSHHENYSQATHKNAKNRPNFIAKQHSLPSDIMTTEVVNDHKAQAHSPNGTVDDDEEPIDNLNEALEHEKNSNQEVLPEGQDEQPGCSLS